MYVATQQEGQAQPQTVWRSLGNYLSTTMTMKGPPGQVTLQGQRQVLADFMH